MAKLLRRLLVTGSLAYDFILEHPGLIHESLGELEESSTLRVHFHTRQMERHFGGCGGNVAYTLALLGDAPSLVAIVGQKTHEYLDHLSSHGVDCEHVRVEAEGTTATCVIINDQIQNRIVAFHGGVVDRAGELDPEPAIAEDIFGAIVTPDDVPAMVRFADTFRRRQLPYFFDFGSQVTWLSGAQLRDSIEGAQGAFCNEYEFAVFEKNTGWNLEATLQRVPLLVITRGAEGSIIHQPGKEALEVPSCPLRGNPVDPSGAGDAYRAGFGFGWVRGWPWRRCAQLGSTTAAFALKLAVPRGTVLIVPTCSSVASKSSAACLKTYWPPSDRTFWRTVKGSQNRKGQSG